MVFNKHCRSNAKPLLKRIQRNWFLFTNERQKASVKENVYVMFGCDRCILVVPMPSR